MRNALAHSSPAGDSSIIVKICLIFLGLVVYIAGVVVFFTRNYILEDAVSITSFKVVHDFDDSLESAEDSDVLRNSLPLRYEPTWESLDSRPLPSWYDEAKIGIFLHWGVFSVPSFGDAWFWYWWKGPEPRHEYVEFMRKNYPSNFTYADFAADLTAKFYDPQTWAEIFNASGAKYVVITSKHHEGFCMWPTNHSLEWNAMDMGPKRDLVGDLEKALRKDTDIRFGIYHSLYEFFNPLLMADKDNNFATQEYVKAKITPSLQELVHRYKPDLLWSDNPWLAEDIYWNSTHFLAWLYNDSPVRENIVTNDRWGRYTPCKHGGYVTCRDHFNPKVLWRRKFEDATTMTKRGWSFRRDMNLSDVHSMEDITKLIAEVVSCGGNLLINVGPTKDGVIVPIFEERLRQMGDWLRVNGDAIYKTRPWTFRKDPGNRNVWYTRKMTDDGLTVYAILLQWPDSESLTLFAPRPGERTEVTMLGSHLNFSWTLFIPVDEYGMVIHFPPMNYRQVPCKWAWVLKLTHIQN